MRTQSAYRIVRPGHISFGAVHKFLAGLLILACGTASAGTFVVNNRFDTGTGGCTASECTLREAMTAATAAGTHVINFSFAANAHSPEVLIQPTSPLPTITQALTINGYSVAASSVNSNSLASNAVLRIRVDGLNAGANASGLAICHGSVKIRGLSVTRFSKSGIAIGADSAGSGCNFGGSVDVLGNFIGLASNGTTAAGNTLDGLFVRQGFENKIGASRVTIGVESKLAFAVADRNVLSANGGNGILLATVSNAAIFGNLIGTDKSGALDRGNTGAGVLLSSATSTSTIGIITAEANAPNLIRFNAIGISALATSSIVNNLWTVNRIYDNDALGIDLGNNGVTGNDLDDADTGPNGLQNFPPLSGADRILGGVQWQGTLDVPVVGSAIYTLSVYANSSCDASTFGEGQIFLGTKQLTLSNGAGQLINSSLTTSTTIPPGSLITMTATGPDGTSEFSNCVAVDPPPLVVNTTDDVFDSVCDAAHCSLREAITAANFEPTVDVITFDIASPASGELMIQPDSPLPVIVSPLTIDGYTQSGTTANSDAEISDATLRIRVDGANAGAGASGFRICFAGVTIKGLSITRFGQDGIQVGANCAGTAFTPTSVLGNFVGIATDGTTSAGNAGSGLRVAVQTQPPLPASPVLPVVNVGSVAVADRNVIGANLQGIMLEQAGSVVVGNLIGTGKDGAVDLGNSVAGILIPGPGGNGNRLGSIGSASAPNLIRFNGDGIQAMSSGVWPENRIYDNDDLGIDLANDGVTDNDPDDIDSGPNNRQNFPVITTAERSAPGIRIAGTLDVLSGTNNQPYLIAIYASSACDGSSHGEGERLLGTATVNLTQGTGESFSFELSTADALEPGVQITSTASGQSIPFNGETFFSEGTSEFSACMPATDAPPGIAVNSLVDPGTGACDLAECTLREAITLANAQAGADLIRFEIPGDGPFLISLSTLLPAVTGPLTIDGYTQIGAFENVAATGSDAVLQIELRDGAALAFGLMTCASDITIRGLSFTAFNTAAIATQMNAAANCAVLGSNVRIQGNYFGLRPNGTAFSNQAGLAVTNTVVTVGGSTLADRNIISNSNTFGLRISGAAASGSRVQNNLFGENRDLDSALPNGVRDIELDSVSDVIVGGTGLELNQFLHSPNAIVVLGATSTGNTLYANEFLNHSGATAIDLSTAASANGIDTVDANDPDIGPNELQNAPVLGAGTATAVSFTLSGTLDVPAGIAVATDYTLAFYESSSCNNSGGLGNGREGQIYLGAQTKQFTSSSENFSVNFNLSPPAAGSFITATATAPNGSTSEFSNCLASPLPTEIFANSFE